MSNDNDNDNDVDTLLLKEAQKILNRDSLRKVIKEDNFGERIKVERTRGVIVAKPIKNLTNRHREIARMAAIGASNKEIASELGLVETTVSAIKNSPAVKAHTDCIQDIMDARLIEAREVVINMLPDALTVLGDTINDENITPGLRFKAATTALSIAGLAPQKHIQVDKRTAILTGADFIKIKERSREESARIIEHS